MNQPETQFATVGNDRVAYQVVGEGPRDIFYTLGFWSHLDIYWEDPAMARLFRRMASFARLIRFDRRGTGLSARASDDGGSIVEHWIQDCIAVLDAVGSTAPVITSAVWADAGLLTLQFVDRYPERCSGLIFANTTACWAAKPDYPQGHSSEVLQSLKDSWLQTWGTSAFASGSTAFVAPSVLKNEAMVRWVSKLQRSMASPRIVVDNMDVVAQLDCRALLPRVHVPTLVMGRSHNKLVPVAQSHYMAEHIPGARFVELPGTDGAIAWETADLILDLIEEFVTGRRHGNESERALVTVLFTDIVDSTQRASELGDTAWRQLLDRHDEVQRDQIALFNGRLVDSAGDGTFATFDRPDRALECARALHEAHASIDIHVRAGIHFGEVELREDERVGGMTVHIGARVLALAAADEVLVSRTVRDILLGSRYKFQERGEHTLKGVPGDWALFALEG